MGGRLSIIGVAEVSESFSTVSFFTFSLNAKRNGGFAKHEREERERCVLYNKGCEKLPGPSDSIRTNEFLFSPTCGLI